MPTTRFFAAALVVALLTACGGGDGGTPAPMQPAAPGAFVSPPNDPLYAMQWFLDNTGTGLRTVGEDVRAENAWGQMTGMPAEPVSGRGVRVVVIDDGLLQAHEDLAGNVILGAGGTYNGMGVLVNNDPSPGDPMSQHGTSVAGVAAGIGHNGIGISGVAPRASLVGLVNAGTDASDAAAMTKDINTNHIYNMSFGPNENGYYTLTTAVERGAINTGISMGRGGRGVVYLRAAGNGGGNTMGPPGPDQHRFGHHSNLDGFNNEYGVIVVAASDGAGVSPFYNQEGSCMTLCAPSSGNPGGVVTTDVMGSPINNIPTAYTSQFGGTSSSCPAVAGVVALILQVNPILTWRDIRRLLAMTARQNDSMNLGWAMNGAMRMVHHEYGYGVVDAGAAVTAAPGFVTLGPAVVAPFASPVDTPAVPAPIADDMPAGGVARMITVAGAPMSLDQVVVRLNLTTTNLRDHKVVLTSPMGTQSVLLEPNAMKTGPVPGGESGTQGLNGEIRLCTVRLMGEDPNGMWTLTVTDEVAGSEAAATLVSWSLDIYAD